MHNASYLLIIITMMISLPSWADSPILKPITTINAPKGAYIDNAFAVSPNGKQVAYVIVYENGKSFLNFYPTNKKIDITKLTDDPHTITYLPDGAGIILKWKSSNNFFDYAMLDLKGNIKAKFKKITDLTYSTYNNKNVLIAFTQEILKNGTRYTVAVYDLKSPKRPIKKKVINTNLRNMVTKPTDFEVSFFFNDYKQIQGKIIGKYDRKLDRKRPDVAAIYDVFSGQLTKKGIIARVAQWNKQASFFNNYMGWDCVIKLEGLPSINGINGKFQLGLGINNWKNIITQNWNIGRFNFKTLIQYPKAIKGKLYFSLIIDPQNPIILKQKKSEQKFFHVFSLDINSGKANDLGRIQINKGFFKWHTEGHMIAIMNLYKHWTVGALTLSIYNLK